MGNKPGKAGLSPAERDFDYQVVGTLVVEILSSMGEILEGGILSCLISGF